MNDTSTWGDWIGRSETVLDTISAVPARALAATLDHEPADLGEGTALPLPWHWLYGLPLVQQSALGPDGHPKRGGFLPPVPQPQRMWAGSRITVHRPLRIGEAVRRTSTIDAIKVRDGRSGRLVFVTVHHAWLAADAAAPTLEEWQDIVYRDPPSHGEAPPPVTAAPAVADWSQTLHPDPVLLMRYSALTFNSHRIHYDLPYATGVEGYPGLIVHGPLVATLLLDSLQRRHRATRVRTFAFKALRPLICGQPFSVNGRAEGDGAVELWCVDAQGLIAMQANARLE
jgi:3-methylfumaryl-CoA hydratase